jgi:hypothetical protein
LPAAGIRSLWVVDVAGLREETQWSEAFELLLPSQRRKDFSVAVGIDPDQVKRLAWGNYPIGSLWVVELPGGVARATQRFEERAVPGPLRHPGRHGIVRTTAVVDDKPSALVTMGDRLVAWASGDPSLGRIVELRALGKLRRSPAALAGAGLREVAERDAKWLISYYVPGPFDGAAASGLGGVLGRATVVALRARPAGEGRAQLVLELRGDLRAEDGAALSGAYGTLLQGPLGRVLGLREAAEPTVTGTEGAWRLEVLVSVSRLADGLHQLTSAEVTRLLSTGWSGSQSTKTEAATDQSPALTEPPSRKGDQ